MYGFSTPVRVKEIVQGTSGSWWTGAKPPTTVDWTFTPMQHGTFVSIRNFGFSGEPDQRVKQAINSAGGFSLVLAGCQGLAGARPRAWHGRRSPSQRVFARLD